MASRKDKKGRVLQKGEYQRSNGTYQYSYYDITGKRRYLYSKDLMEATSIEEEESIYQQGKQALNEALENLKRIVRKDSKYYTIY